MNLSILQLFTWKENHELMLMKESVEVEPFAKKPSSLAAGQAWQKVTDNLNSAGYGFQVTKRSCRNRFKKIMEEFKLKQSEGRRSSGTDEEYSEIERVCQDIIERIEELDEKDSAAEQTAAKMREKAMNTLGSKRKTAKKQFDDLDDEAESDDDDDAAPEVNEKRVRRKSSDSLALLKDSITQRVKDSQQEREVRQKELQLRQEELKLQKDQQQQMSTMIMQMMQNQQQMMAGLFSHITKKDS